MPAAVAETGHVPWTQLTGEARAEHFREMARRKAAKYGSVTGGRRPGRKGQRGSAPTQALVPMTARGGKPSALTAEVQASVVEAVKLGVPYTWAARAAGVSDSSLSEWRIRGEADAAAGRETPWKRYAEAVKTAEAFAITTHLRSLVGAQHDWQRHAWVLERRWPDEFGRRDALAVQTQGEVRIVVEHVKDWHARDVIDVTPETQALPAKRERKPRELDGQPG